MRLSLSLRLGPVFVLSLTSTLAIALAAAPAPPSPRPPNIVVLLADDLGWAECGFQGVTRDIPTPHLDAIARNGVRFTHAYVAATYCSPSRAGFLTGRYPTRFGYEFIGLGAKGVGLPRTERTIAERLKTLGYATCAIGKWHVGEEPGMLPTDRGFDEYLGMLSNPGSYFTPAKWRDSLGKLKSKDVGYATDAFADRAVDFIRRHRETPFFLYVPFNAVHTPMHATPRHLARFAHIVDESRRTFAAMLSAMDDAVGRITATLRETGLEENTLIVFFSDNGGAPATGANGPFRGAKSTTSEGGIRVPFLLQWKARLPAGKTYDHPVVQLDLLPTFLAAAGGTIHPAWKLDGVDLLPWVTGQRTGGPHDTLYWRFGEQWAIRDGDWKLVASRVDASRPRLIDLARDPAEAHDLSTVEPERVRTLTAKWNAWSTEQIAPLWTDTPQTDPAKKKSRGKAGKKKG